MLCKISTFARFVVSAMFAVLLGCSPAPMLAQESGQQTFASVEDAGQALFTALQRQDDQTPLKILGPEGKDLVASGDPAEDADARTGFVVKYQEMHRFVTEPNGRVELIVGAENWPFPIPLVKKDGLWYFDTAAGKDEIVFRRIGKNEVSAMEACRELVEAQKQYFAHPPAGFPKQFAQKLVSEEGGHDGLYWHGAADEFNSPIDSLIAYADGKDANDKAAVPTPFYGYFFRILTKQGAHAPGGAKNYMVDGKMSSGFAFVAYPAEYRSSGVMTFVVDKSGTIYEKDLGPNTTKLAQTMNAFDPDSTWHKTE